MGTPPVPLGPAASVGRDEAAAFRRLCRSSPWRWKSLRFDVAWPAPARSAAAPGAGDDAGSSGQVAACGTGDDAEVSVPGPGPGAVAVPAVRAWLRRPDALRVEDPDGTLLFSTTHINESRDAFYVAGTRKSWLLPPNLTNPIYDSDGLVRRRPEAAYGDPVFADPRWAAMLDPVELAGNAPVPLEFPFSNVVEIHELQHVRHEGREAVQAVVSPNTTYVAAAPGHPLLDPGTSVVRIDVQTGVCVYSESLEGPWAGRGHSMRIIAVDEYMLDDLFVERSMHLTDVRDHIPWIVRPEPGTG